MSFYNGEREEKKIKATFHETDNNGRGGDMKGAIFSEIDVRDYRGVCANTNMEFPKEFELEMVRVKSQGKINSCVAHVLSSIIEYYNSIQQKSDTEMSVGYIYGNRTNSNHKEYGMVIRDALETIRLYGDVPKSLFPYNKEVPEAIQLYENNAEELYEIGYQNRISSYYKLDSESAIKTALMNGNPIAVGVKWYKDMEVVNGILTSDFKEADYSGGHCMLLYGWDEIGWKIQNSWGFLWGNKGCVIIPYDMELRECWAVTDDIVNSNMTNMTIKKPFSSDIGKIIAKILNYVLRIIKAHIA